MKSLFALAALAVLVASPAEAGGFRVYDMKSADSGECDCYVGVRRLDAKSSLSELSELGGRRAFLNLDGHSVALEATDEETSDGWTI